MVLDVSAAGARVRVIIERGLARLGFGDESFTVLLAVLIGIVTGAAAVGFHELIVLIRKLLYANVGESLLYGKAVWLLILIPAAGGLVVALLSRYVFGARE